MEVFMIEAEVVFDGEYIHCNGYLINCEYDTYTISLDGRDIELCITIERAIQYCMEN